MLFHKNLIYKITFVFARKLRLQNQLKAKSTEILYYSIFALSTDTAGGSYGLSEL